MNAPRSTKCSDESGFTLIEVLVAISITSLILVVIGFAVTQSFTNTVTTSNRIDRATASNFASRYFSGDVASSTSAPSPYLLSAQHNPPCGTGRTLIDIPTATGTTVSYIVVAGATANTLSRRVCNSGTNTEEERLGQTNDAFNKVGSNATGAGCTAGGVCTLTISWNAPTYSFSVTGTRRQISG